MRVCWGRDLGGEEGEGVFMALSWRTNYQRIELVVQCWYFRGGFGVDGVFAKDVELKDKEYRPIVSERSDQRGYERFASLLIGLHLLMGSGDN